MSKTAKDKKNCTKCEESKPLSDFYLSKTGKYRSSCKKCDNAMSRAYKAKSKAHISEYNKNYKVEHKDEISVYNHQYHKENKKNIMERHKKTRRIRRENDLNFKITTDLRSNLYKYIKSEGKQLKEMEKILGCGWDSFDLWLTYQFDDNMNFENYGKYWTIDHVNPCCNFDLTQEDDKCVCFNWSNLRPVLKMDNSKKVGKTILKELNKQKKQKKEFMEFIEEEEDYYN
jgi:hypothetical protein